MRTEDKLTVPKISIDGSNWDDYRHCVLWLLELKNIDAHRRGHYAELVHHARQGQRSRTSRALDKGGNGNKTGHWSQCPKRRLRSHQEPEDGQGGLGNAQKYLREDTRTGRRSHAEVQEYPVRGK
jgi:hypothetical protein